MGVESYGIYISTTNDCGVSWNWQTTSSNNGTPIQYSGSFVSGETDQGFVGTTKYPNTNLLLSYPVTSFNVNFTAITSGSATLINTSF
jgi:hypothetical protein